MNKKIFHTYYDVLYGDKPYKQEVKKLFTILGKLGVLKPRHLLEIGCGTGNHTQYLARNVSKITAIDTDPKMVEIATKKIKQFNLNIQVKLTTVNDLKPHQFDLACALFNVVTYINTIDELIVFFKGIYRSLHEDSYFIFDAWNGIAALRNPPKRKKISIKKADLKVSAIIIPKTDYVKQITELTYHLRVKTGSTVHNEIYKLQQTLWTPREIEFALEKGGFKMQGIYPLFTLSRKIKETDWKIMYIAKKL